MKTRLDLYPKFRPLQRIGLSHDGVDLTRALKLDGTASRAIVTCVAPISGIL